MAKSKKSCPIKNDEAMLEVAAPIFDEMIERYSNLDLTKSQVLNSVKPSALVAYDLSFSGSAE